MKSLAILFVLPIIIAAVLLFIIFLGQCAYIFVLYIKGDCKEVFCDEWRFFLGALAALPVSGAVYIFWVILIFDLIGWRVIGVVTSLVLIFACEALSVYFLWRLGMKIRKIFTQCYPQKPVDLLIAVSLAVSSVLGIYLSFIVARGNVNMLKDVLCVDEVIFIIGLPLLPVVILLGIYCWARCLMRTDSLQKR